MTSKQLDDSDITALLWLGEAMSTLSVEDTNLPAYSVWRVWNRVELWNYGYQPRYGVCIARGEYEAMCAAMRLMRT